MKKRYLFMCLSVMILTVLVLASCGECNILHTEHEFNERVASEEYFAQEATCSSGPRYYYSCKCGAKHSEWSFESGMRNPTAHHIVNGVCTLCNLPESTPAEGLIFSLTSEGDGYVLTDAKNCTATEVTVGLYNGLPVKWVAKEAFYGNAAVQKITLADAVRGIGDRAFDGCSSLTEIRLPRDIDTLPLFCFRRCTSLKTVEIPGSVRTLEEGVFEGCTALEKINIPDGIRYIGTRAFGGCTQLCVTENGVIYIGTWAYSYSGNADEITELTLRPGTKGIMRHAFQNLKQLKKVVTGGDIRVIEEYAFQGCEALTEIALPSSLVVIGESAFRGCSSLAALDLPEIMWEIGEYAFAECTSLESIRFPAGIDTVEKGTFEGCTALKTAVLDGKELRTVDMRAFYGCSSLETVTLYSATDDLQYYSVRSICEKAFAGCTALADINLPNQTDLYIGIEAFDGCDGVIENINGVRYVGRHVIGCDRNVTEAILRDGTLTVAEGTFEECASLTYVLIPASVSQLNITFWGCTALDCVVLPKWEDIDPYIFKNQKPSTVYYLGSAQEFQKAVDQLNGLYGDNPFTAITVCFYSETEPTEAGSYWHFDADGKPAPW